MHIAIVGPISTEYIKPLLSVASDNLPKGYSGAPLLGTLIKELLNRGHCVSAFTTSLGLPLSRSRWVTVCNDRFKVHYISQRPHAFRPKHGQLGRAMDFFSLERAALAEAIKVAAPDVVHAHWAYEFGLAAIASGLPHVVTCHDSPDKVLKYMPNAYRLARFLMGRQCLKNAGVVTAVSPYLRDAVQKYCKVQVDVVQNPLPNSLFERNEHLSNRITEKGGSRRIAMVLNGWGSRKNPEPALKAFGMLKTERHRNLEMHLFGTDFGPGEIAEHWCQQHGLSKGLFFHGLTPHCDLLSKLESMDLMIHPALEESFGMGIAEAMSLGLPVIGGDNSGGVTWVIGNGGITTDITSPYAIANAVDELLTNAGAWQHCSKSALSRSQIAFNAQRVTELYEYQYSKAIVIYKRVLS